MGPYDEAKVRYQLSQAAGPYRLDLGDVIYAPNILDDPNGRCILWAWAQEHRTVGSYDFAGCMATPRVLLRRDHRLVQQPLPELQEVCILVVHV
jgi:beta-fructofuranosidase